MRCARACWGVGEGEGESARHAGPRAQVPFGAITQAALAFEVNKDSLMLIIKEFSRFTGPPHGPPPQ